MWYSFCSFVHFFLWWYILHGMIFNNKNVSLSFCVRSENTATAKPLKMKWQEDVLMRYGTDMEEDKMLGEFSMKSA